MRTNRNIRTLAVLLVLAVLATACGSEGPGPAQPAPEQPTPEGVSAHPEPGLTVSPLPLPSSKPALPVVELSPLVVPQTPEPVTGEAPAALLSAVVADLQARLGVASDTITVVRDQAVTWPDGSLGCAEPGMAYTQALVEGYWVVVAQGGREYDYRSGRAGFFILCEQAGRTGPLPSDGAARE